MSARFLSKALMAVSLSAGVVVAKADSSLDSQISDQKDMAMPPYYVVPDKAQAAMIERLAVMASDHRVSVLREHNVTAAIFDSQTEELQEARVASLSALREFEFISMSLLAQSEGVVLEQRALFVEQIRGRIDVLGEQINRANAVSSVETEIVNYDAYVAQALSLYGTMFRDNAYPTYLASEILLGLDEGVTDDKVHANIDLLVEAVLAAVFEKEGLPGTLIAPEKIIEYGHIVLNGSGIADVSDEQISDYETNLLWFGDDFIRHAYTAQILAPFVERSTHARARFTDAFDGMNRACFEAMAAAGIGVKDTLERELIELSHH